MIYIIITTSIYNTKEGIIDYEHRKQRYIDSITQTLNILKPFNIKPIIVENNGLSSDTYLDELPCDILHTNNNSLYFTHKGVNELLDIKQVIDHYQISDDDLIIKLTGRYKLLDDTFLQIINENMHKHDAFVKFFNVCTLRYQHCDCVLGLFAAKCKYIKHFEYSCKKSPEVEFATFVRNNIQTVMEIDNLNIECCFADDLRILRV